VSVEEGLAALDDHRRALQTNCVKVRGEIGCAMERQMKQLRSRERQLVRQLELATTHSTGAASLTAAQLQQHKGALAVTRSLLDCQESSPALVSSVDSCNQEITGLLQHAQKLVRVPMVSCSMEDAGLGQAIGAFGRVSMPGPLSSSALPCPPEEYGDAPHDVLHKSVPARPAVIDMRKPYLLAAKRGLGGPGAAQPSVKTPCVEGEEPLLKWLARMQLEDSAPQLPDVEEACQANAPCSSYEQCCLGGACERGAREKAEQGARWILKQRGVEGAGKEGGEGGKEQVLAHMRQLATSEDGKWLSEEVVRTSASGAPVDVEDHRMWLQREEEEDSFSGVKEEEEEEEDEYEGLDACCSPKRSYIEDAWQQEFVEARVCKKPKFEGADFNEDYKQTADALFQQDSFEESPSAPVLCEFENIKNSSMKNWLMKDEKNVESEKAETDSSDNKLWLASQIDEVKEWKLDLNQENNKDLEDKEDWEKWYREDVDVDDGEKDKEGVDMVAVLDDIGRKEGWLWRDSLKSEAVKSYMSDKSDWLSTCSSYSVLESERSWLAVNYEM